MICLSGNLPGWGRYPLAFISKLWASGNFGPGIFKAGHGVHMGLTLSEALGMAMALWACQQPHQFLSTLLARPYSDLKGGENPALLLECTSKASGT